MEKTRGTHEVMSTLVTSHGVLTDTPAIIKETTQFYADLFTAEPVDQSFVNYFLHDVKRLPDELKFTCDVPITYHECIKAISAMKNGKSPGMNFTINSFLSLAPVMLKCLTIVTRAV